MVQVLLCGDHHGVLLHPPPHPRRPLCLHCQQVRAGYKQAQSAKVIYQSVKFLFTFLLPARLISILVPRRRRLVPSRAMVPATYHHHHHHLHNHHNHLSAAAAAHHQQNVDHEDRNAEQDGIERCPDTVRGGIEWIEFAILVLYTQTQYGS